MKAWRPWMVGLFVAGCFAVLVGLALMALPVNVGGRDCGSVIAPRPGDPHEPGETAVDDIFSDASFEARFPEGCEGGRDSRRNAGALVILAGLVSAGYVLVNAQQPPSGEGG